MNRRGVTLLLLLDLSAAFDTFDHSILLDRLHTHFGISGGTCALLIQVLLALRDSKPYLFTAKHQRGLRQSMAFHMDLVLVPPYFSLSKLYTIIERHHAYADDTQLYISFNANSSEEQSAALENMQNERLDAI